MGFVHLSSREEPYQNMARTIFAQDPARYIPALADILKKIPEFEIPEWALYVKSGCSKERPPVDEDFWYIRAASILRYLYIKGVVGVGRLRTRYGSRKNRGARPDKFYKASGKMIRIILQQAEAAGLVEKMSKMQFGRRLTQVGRDLLDSIDAPYEVIDNENWIAQKLEVVGVEEESENYDAVDDDDVDDAVHVEEGEVEQAEEGKE
jgi:small subunit ribosomal protein S19e